jgi:hypothetical protein
MSEVRASQQKGCALERAARNKQRRRLEGRTAGGLAGRWIQRLKLAHHVPGRPTGYLLAVQSLRAWLAAEFQRFSGFCGVCRNGVVESCYCPCKSGGSKSFDMQSIYGIL